MLKKKLQKKTEFVIFCVWKKVQKKTIKTMSYYSKRKQTLNTLKEPKYRDWLIKERTILARAGKTCKQKLLANLLPSSAVTIHETRLTRTVLTVMRRVISPASTLQLVISLISTSQLIKSLLFRLRSWIPAALKTFAEIRFTHSCHPRTKGEKKESKEKRSNIPGAV